jgi:diguanylate cyclase (GGDEF)-like protein/putative nucleotidyltransferase with HDIG domain
LWDEDAAELDCRFYVADGVRRPEMQKRLKRGIGLAWALVDERRTLNVPDYLDECQRRGLLPTGYGDEPRTETNPWLGVALQTGGRLIGAMAVQRLGRPFSTEEATTLELLGVQIAATMENARLYAEARQLACSDPLTWLANHRHLQEQLDVELARAARLGQPLAAIMADLNNFKLFNDTYGHPAGDQVLRLVASALRAESRLADVVGRYGGDEFLLLLPGVEAAGAAAFIERVQARVATLTPLLGTASAVPLTFSAGVAVYPHDARTRHDLIALADSALYSSKRGGGRTVVTAAAHAAPLDLAADNTSFGVVEGLVLAVDAKDDYTMVHSAVVADTAVLLAEELGLSARDCAIVRTAGLLHDVGKISIPDRVLRKPAPLNKDEWSIMRQHVEFGELIIRGVPGLRDILDPVRHHHERWDGGGYPRGLVGESVPLLGRIMILADAYSAMILDRPYRRGLTVEAALAQIRAGAGSQFDPELAELLCCILERDLPVELQAVS